MSVTREVAWLVEPGWVDVEIIRGIGEPTRRMLFYADGTVRFEHECRVIDGTRLVVAPALQLDGGHKIEARNPLTVSPSILCPDCGTHGFVQRGRWAPA